MQPDFASFRKPPSPAAPAFATPAVDPQAQAFAAAFPGQQLPMPIGRPLTAAEAKVVSALGWQQGEPVPGDLPALLARISADQKHAATDVRGILPVAADTAPVKMQVVDINSLPPEQQEAFRKDFRIMIDRDKARLADASKPAPTLAPGVSEALAVANAMPAVGLSVTQNAGSVSQGPPRGTAVTSHHVPGFDAGRLAAAAAAQRDQAKTAPAQPPPLPPDPPVVDAGHAPGNCPHCGWDLDRPDEIEPTDVDKLAFLAMVLGGPEVRFRKEVAMFGGRVVANFRTLTPAEAELAFRQALDDRVNGKFQIGFEQAQAIHRYRLVLSLESIESQGTGLTPVASLAAEAPSEGQKTILPELLAFVLTSVLPHENVLKAVEQAFLRFQTMAEKMESRVNDDSFWPGIGERP